MIDLTKPTAGQQLSQLINQDLASTEKKNMKVSKRYFNKDHDINKYKLYYVDSDGVVREEKGRSNIKIAHPFYTELVNQKVNYLLSKAIQFTSTNERLQSYLDSYLDANFQLLINDLVEGASIKGYEGLYYKYDSKGKINFEIADAYNLICLYDEKGNMSQVIRHFKTLANINGKQEVIQRAEVYTNEGITYFVKEKDNYIIDSSKPLNPQPYKIIKVGDKLYRQKNSKLPFLILTNNAQSTTDLDGIKDLIDDYDLNASSLSNNLAEFDYPLIAVKGYEGDNLDGLINNLKTRKTIGLASDGDLQVRTIDIPVEARKAKLQITKESIYKFGMGFDSSLDNGDTALTNIGIKSRYSLLDIKANKTQVRLLELLQKVIGLILENIKELHNETFNVNDVDIVITRVAMTNDKEKAEEENILAQAQATRINSIINSSIMLDKTLVAKLLAEELGLETKEVLEFIESEDYIEPLNLPANE